MVTDILVSASGSIWTLQGNTGPGLEWLWRNTGLVAGRCIGSAIVKAAQFALPLASATKE